MLLRCACAVLLLFALRPSPASTQQDSRIRYTINDNWSYRPEGGAAIPVHLPHTWNVDDALTESIEYRRGIGWYRKPLPIDSTLAGKRLFIYFEGVNQIADVFVNGDSIGRHVGGYTAFAFEITGRVRTGENEIAVRVDNRHNDDVPPLNADFTFYGGIYRDVWLIATDPVHIDVLDHASPGVFIDTPGLTAGGGSVRVRGGVVNQSGRTRNVQVVSRITDASGREVTVFRSHLRLASGQTARFEQRSSRIEAPHLWSPDDPYLHRVETLVFDGDRLLDRVTNPLGFRWFTVDAQRGFFLNGRPFRLYGTNRHQDRSGYGNALPDWAHRADVENVKATGFNFLRLAHYPQDPAVLEAMDRAGLVGWEEIPVVNIISLSPQFADNAERMLVEMIRQHYNHPSILFWGYMNEVLLRKPDPMPAGYRARVLELARRLDARAHVEDPGRKTVMAISIEEIDDGSGMQDVADVIGFNLYFGWYYRTLEGLGAYLDSLHVRHPQRPLMVSEYGADSDERIHTLRPVAFDFSNEHQQRFHESQFPQMRARNYILGTAVWNQFDFGSKGRHDSKPNLNQKGLLYFDRTPKDIWHYYRALLLETRVLHIATRDWGLRAGSRPADAQQPVTVYSNAERVELFLNGQSLGAQAPANATARWMVPLRHGPNRLEARTPDGAFDAATIDYDDRTSLFGSADPASRIIAVNAGSHYQYVDAGGTVWEADRPYESGSWGYRSAGTPRLRHHRIFGSQERDALFQAHHEGVREYQFDVPDGTYDVQLLFAENETDKAGGRVFSVSVNDTRMFVDLDLAKTSGRYHAVERRTEAKASNGRGITIRLQPKAGETTISGVLLRRR